MTSASFLHPPTTGVSSSTISAGSFNSSTVVVTVSGSLVESLPQVSVNNIIGVSVEEPATSLTSSTSSSSSERSTASSTSSVDKIQVAPHLHNNQVNKKSRRRRTSDTILATASAILKMLGVSTSSSAGSADAAAAAAEESSSSGQGAQSGKRKDSVTKINAIPQQQQPEKVMPAMPKAKSSSISETDYEEMRNKEQLFVKLAPEEQVNSSKCVVGAASGGGGNDEEVKGASRTQQPSCKPKSTAPARRSANDYRFGKTIGEGSFSTVYLAKDIHSGKEYAIKVCEKQHIIREGKQEYIKREREVLNVLSGCPGFVNLYCTFQDARRLYFVLTYAKSGDLLPHINKVGSFDQPCTKFYAAELVLALENMHKRGVIHRDLKPENVLLDEKMHTQIADFGSAKLVEGGVAPVTSNVEASPLGYASEESENGRGMQNPRYQRGRKNSFVGTAQYVSPEILKGQPSTAAVDLWALGCIIYQMVSGLPPFRGNSEYLIFQKILKQDFTFPDGFDEAAKDLVERLLVLDPCARIGAKDRNRYDSIRSHPFFEGIDWERLYEQDPPKIYPYLPGLDDVRTTAYRVPDHLEPGLGERQLTRLLGLDLGTATLDGEDGGGDEEEEQVPKKRSEPKSIADVSEAEKRARMEKQKTDKWDAFADGELILKQGFVSKRKGLFARKRMLLLTTGPRLIYIDPAQMVKKGEIPWSEELRVEPRNFKIFFVHTPNRTYYLEDPDGFALKWCDAIKDVGRFTYGTASGSSSSGCSQNGVGVTDYRYSST